MSDLRSSFPILEDVSTSGGSAPTRSIEGDASAGKVGLVAFGFKDSSGNIVLPSLDNQGRLPVTTEPQGTRKRSPNATVAGGSASGTFVTVASITLNASKNYVDMLGSVNCRRAALFQLCKSDNGVITVLDETILDAGQYRAPIGIPNDEMSTGSTGTQLLLVRAYNLGVPSDLHATIVTDELAGP